MSKPDVGVIVGRFQVHRLTEAQRDLIAGVYDSHAQTVVVLGLSQARVSTRNPLDYEARKQMLLAEFPKATVLFLKDEASDYVWSANLDRLLATYLTPAQSVCLYGGRDSFKASYHGRLPVVELESASFASGTAQRRSITRSVRGTEDFRAGVIWASANVYPRVHTTTDVAVHDGPRLLMVRKPDETLWRFPGGFVAPTDPSLEAAAAREVLEETGASIGPPRYICSCIVDDWRYRREADRIMTTLFAAAYQFGPVAPADDVAEARWLDLDDVADPLIVPEHRPLWRAAGAFLAPRSE